VPAPVHTVLLPRNPLTHPLNSFSCPLCLTVRRSNDAPLPAIAFLACKIGDKFLPPSSPLRTSDSLLLPFFDEGESPAPFCPRPRAEFFFGQRLHNPFLQVEYACLPSLFFFSSHSSQLVGCMLAVRRPVTSLLPSTYWTRWSGQGFSSPFRFASFADDDEPRPCETLEKWLETPRANPSYPSPSSNASKNPFPIKRSLTFVGERTPALPCSSFPSFDGSNFLARKAAFHPSFLTSDSFFSSLFVLPRAPLHTASQKRKHAGVSLFSPLTTQSPPCPPGNPSLFTGGPLSLPACPSLPNR